MTDILTKYHGHKSVRDMSENEKIIYNLLIDCDYLTTVMLAEKIGKSGKTVYRTIKSLKEKGYIERVGNDKNGYWKILR